MKNVTINNNTYYSSVLLTLTLIIYRQSLLNCETHLSRLCSSGCEGGFPALQTEIRFWRVRLLCAGPAGGGGSEEEGILLQKVLMTFLL